MRILFFALLALLPPAVQAEACVVHSRSDQVEVKLCQQNISIPQKMFHEGFCQPKLPEQSIEVAYTEQCPTGAYGACRNARVSSMPYRQDIHYYGIASDSRILKLACTQQYQGVWEAF